MRVQNGRGYIDFEMGQGLAVRATVRTVRRVGKRTAERTGERTAERDQS